jgi:hypothetical protein
MTLCPCTAGGTRFWNSFKSGLTRCLLFTAAALTLPGFGQQAADSKPRVKVELIITSTNIVDWEPQRGEIPRLRTVGNLTGHAGLIKLSNLTIGEAYSGHISLRDPDDKEVPLKQNRLDFTAEASSESYWCVYFPPYEKQKPGKWKWTADVEKVGRVTVEINVEKPTVRETETLEPYEKAWDEVLNAFAHSWLGVKDDYFSLIVISDRNAADDNEALREKWRETAYKLSETKRLRDRSSPKNTLEGFNNEIRELEAELETLGTKSRPPFRTNLVQISELSNQSVPGLLTAADKLNGFTHSSSTRFGFTLFRRFDYAAGGWTDWEDVARVPEFFSGLVGRFASSGMFPNLSFTVTERDRHWRVTTDNGQLFIDKKRADDKTSAADEHKKLLDREAKLKAEAEELESMVRTTGRARDGSPNRFAIKLPQVKAELAEARKARSDWERALPAVTCVLPDDSIVEAALKSGKTPRQADKELADWINQHAQEPEGRIKRTMDMVRGKPAQ